MVKVIKVMLIPNNVQKTKMFQYAGASRFAITGLWPGKKKIMKSLNISEEENNSIYVS